MSDIILSIQDSEYHKINGAQYRKGTVSYELLPDNGGYAIMYTVGGVARAIGFGDWRQFKNGDEGDAPFASETELDDYMDNAFNIYLPQARPFRLVSAADTNATVIKAGRVHLHKLNVTNTAEVTAYLKVYDIGTTPSGTDTPVMVIPIVAKTEDTPIEIVDRTISFSYGLALRITAAIADADETAIAADSVTVNAIYQ